MKGDRKSPPCAAYDAILFDLDGTLLPMDQEAFLAGYFALIGREMATAFDSGRLLGAIGEGVSAMLRNDGRASNEAVFWDAVSARFPSLDRETGTATFMPFYQTAFDALRAHTWQNPAIPALIAALKKTPMRLILATNPVFPRLAVEKRLAWAGLSPSDFAAMTAYETARHAKPHPDYYRDICADLSLSPARCLMVGNDVSDDMLPARAAGMQVFLLTDCLINEKGLDLTPFPSGDIAALQQFLLREG